MKVPEEYGSIEPSMRRSWKSINSRPVVELDAEPVPAALVRRELVA